MTAVYDFAFRGLLAEEALDRAGRRSKNMDGLADVELAKALSLDQLDTELVESAKRMAIVYIAICAFENSARRLVVGLLSESAGENWWAEKVSENIRKRAQGHIDEEKKIRWHKARGDDPINYTQLPDLISIMRTNWLVFEPYCHQQDWAANIFEVLERSRNAIMHSGTLDRGDIERVGIYIRDWVKQVGV